jgi:hypothetical protein
MSYLSIPSSMRHLLIGALLACLFPLGLHAQALCTLASRERCESHLQALAEASLADQDMGDLALLVGRRFMGIPYVSKTLEQGEAEQLVVEMEGMDCTTFLENVVVFSRLIKRQRLTFEDFQLELEKLRYRDGLLQGYPSRLHYFTDWIHDNERKGIVRDVTRSLGGIPYTKVIDFMSAHREAYRQLSEDQYFAAMQQLEQEINRRPRFFIPKDRIAAAESAIQDGDLIAITTSIRGLDIVHVGLAIHQQGRLHLMHASTDQKEVVISAKPLAEYLMGNRSQSGVMVARLAIP